MYGFIGIDENGKITNLYRDEADYNNDTDYSINDLRTLLGKDYYVILRPSIVRLEITMDYSQTNIADKNYITNIKLDTKLNEFTSNITTNGIITVQKNNTIITNNEKISTGMNVNISFNNESVEYITSVKGDANGDGKCDIFDIMNINKHRLKKIQLENEYFLAGNVNADNEIDMKDIWQMNKFRLGKIDNF